MFDPPKVPIGNLISPHDSWSEYPGVKRSAVCLLLIPGPADRDEPHIVLTKRSLHVGTHKGQIGLPGGIAEESDASPVETAKRELNEELGVNTKDVFPLGQLPTLQALGNFPVVPIVAWANITASSMVISDREVAEIITAPWTEFKRSRSVPFSFNIFGSWRNSHLFKVANQNVWGLTAQMLFSADFGES